MLIAFFNTRNSNHKLTCVEHIPNINFVFYPVKSDALTILQECPKYNANNDDDDNFPQVASCPGWLVGGISYLGPVLILFRLHSTPSNMSFIKDYSDGDEED